MKYETVTLDQKILVGVSAVTSNSDPKMGETIGGLWKDLYQKGIYETIKNKVNHYAIGLYSDYADDKYCITVGTEVQKAENNELITKIIPAGKYAKFSLKGNMVKAVADSWGEIWSMNLDRSYTGDFEEYLDNETDNANINIYIALKN